MVLPSFMKGEKPWCYLDTTVHALTIPQVTCTTKSINTKVTNKTVSFIVKQRYIEGNLQHLSNNVRSTD